MDHSSLPTAAAPSSAHPSFGGLRPADLSIRIAEAIKCGATAALAINTEDIRDLTSGRPLMSAPLTAATDRVGKLIGDLRAAEPTDLLTEMVASLEQAAARLNEASALVNTLSGDAAVRAIQAAQVWLQSAAMDVRWEVELVQAAMEFEVADENRRAQNLLSASRSWPMPVFRPAPDMPRDAGSVNAGVILGVVALIFVALFCWALSGKAEARSLDGPPVTAVKVQPAKSKPKCAPIYRATVPVHVTARSTADGKFHGAVWLQQRYERPRFNKQTKKWEYFRARLVGAAVSDTPVVKVSGCIDPRKVDGLGGPIYLLLNDVVDDDQDSAGRIDRGTVRVRFVEGRGWKQASK